MLKYPWTCFNPRHYGTLILAAPRRSLGSEEIGKLRYDIENTQLSLVVFGEWQADMNSISVINQLLRPYFIELGERRYSGEFSFDVAPYLVGVSSSPTITRFPKNGFLLASSLLNEVTALTNSTFAYEDVAVFGYIPNVTIVVDNFSWLAKVVVDRFTFLLIQIV